jgi:putative nucleotidyltransferase with HDIG domain
LWSPVGHPPVIYGNIMNMERKKKTMEAYSAVTNSRWLLWGLLVGVTVVFTVILFPTMAVKKHTYELGDVAQRDIKAPYDFFVKDEGATRANRRQAAEAVLTVYDHNTHLVPQIEAQLAKSFGDLRAVIQMEKERPVEPQGANTSPVTGNDEEISAFHNRVWQLKPDFEASLGLTVSDGAYSILEKNEFSMEIQRLIASIVTTVLDTGVVANKEVLLQEEARGITLRNLETGTEKEVMGLKRYYGTDQAKTMVRIVGQPLLTATKYTEKGLIVDFSQRLVTPSITLNLSETKERRKKAMADIKPFLYKIKAGEMILREGERVTGFQLRKIEAMKGDQSQDDQFFTSRLGAAMIVLCLLLVSYVLFVHRHPVLERNRNKNLMFLTAALITFLLLVKVSFSLIDGLGPSAPFSISATSMYGAIPFSAAAMTVCLFLNLELALPFTMVLAVGTAPIFDNRFDLFIFFLLSSSMGAYWMRHCRERIVFIKAGLKLGLANVVFITAVNIYSGNLSVATLLWNWLFAFLGGVFSGMVTAGLTPLVESAFGYTTDTKLLELVNLDRPILRRMMIEASGTYHHSVIVGSMVEAAASAIGANPLLARACGYYHDIGKINKPLYFIENQMGGKNRHDKLAPSMSALILISHIKDGVEIASEHKLGQAIIDTIQQHHGTSLISFFYEKAKQIRGEENVNIDDFRYSGPKPQTREAGLVMLADVIEAASRTLENPTPSRIRGLVQNLINKVFSDGELDNCELTLKDLHNIAKSFIKILDGIYHHRIEYPESQVPGVGKAKNGSIDRQQARPVDSSKGNDRDQSPSRLRRLGQS